MTKKRGDKFPGTTDVVILSKQTFTHRDHF